MMILTWHLVLEGRPRLPWKLPQVGGHLETEMSEQMAPKYGKSPQTLLDLQFQLKIIGIQVLFQKISAQHLLLW